MTAPVPEPDEGDDDGSDSTDPEEGEAETFALDADEDQETGEPEQPAGNASRDVWADYALAVGADPNELDGLGRNAIRDQYGY